MAEILGDWGEFRLLKEVVIPALSAGALAAPLGDDCCAVTFPQSPGELILTADAAPKPLVWELGHESYETWGWYSVLINVSDLAAAGAKPVAFTSSVEAPNTMPVESFRQFFQGMAAACKSLGIPNAGGNIEMHPDLNVTVPAIGMAEVGNGLKRSGCKPGDRVVVIGPCGRFISTYLRAKFGGFDHLSTEEREVLCHPRPKTGEMLALSSVGVVSSATDNSDGILGCLMNIADASGCGVEINSQSRLFPRKCAVHLLSMALIPGTSCFSGGIGK